MRVFAIYTWTSRHRPLAAVITAEGEPGEGAVWFEVVQPIVERQADIADVIRGRAAAFQPETVEDLKAAVAYNDMYAIGETIETETVAEAWRLAAGLVGRN